MLKPCPCVVELVWIRSLFLPFIKIHAVVLRDTDSTGAQMFHVLQSRMLHCSVPVPLLPLWLMRHTVWLKWHIHWDAVHMTSSAANSTSLWSIILWKKMRFKYSDGKSSGVRLIFIIDV